jgi:hypothetical protein
MRKTLQNFGTKTTRHDLNNPPENLKEKVEMLKLVRSELESGLFVIEGEDKTFMDSWLQDKETEAILFRLINRTSHVWFKDGSSIILEFKSKESFYINKEGILEKQPIAAIGNSRNAEIRDRARIFKILLERMSKIKKRQEQITLQSLAITVPESEHQ